MLNCQSKKENVISLFLKEAVKQATKEFKIGDIWSEDSSSNGEYYFTMQNIHVNVKILQSFLYLVF